MVKYDKPNIRAWSLLGIAPSIFINGVADVMRRHDEVMLATADTGRYCGFQKMESEFSDRIVNVGIAEQNLLGVAAGMALEGKRVYVTTYAPFLAFRGADQLRHLAGSCGLDIKAIGTAAGFTAATSGCSLMAVNDIAFARSIPNMTVLSPADCTEAMKQVTAIGETSGPVYMRFCGLTGLPVVYPEDFDYTIGKANVLRRGSGVAILATGTGIVSEALKAAKLLADEAGLNPTVADIHTIKPLDADFIRGLREDHSLVVTVEEHSVIGGLGSAVAECLSTTTGGGGGLLSQLIIGVEEGNLVFGDRKFMLKSAGLDAEGIAARVKARLDGGQ